LVVVFLFCLVEGALSIELVVQNRPLIHQPQTDNRKPPSASICFCPRVVNF
jgi:hypothetical protein